MIKTALCLTLILIRNELFNTGLEEQRRKLWGDPEEQQKSIIAACKEANISITKFN